jgi:hypothetical protein
VGTVLDLLGLECQGAVAAFRPFTASAELILQSQRCLAWMGFDPGPLDGIDGLYKMAANTRYLWWRFGPRWQDVPRETRGMMFVADCKRAQQKQQPLAPTRSW